MRTFHIQTLGCKVNQYESEQIATFLRTRGLSETTADQAELHVLNTCSVTIQAASQSRQAIRGAVRKHSATDPSGCPPAKPRVLVVGCWATSNRPEAAALAGVDAVITHQDNLAAELDQLLALWQSPTGLPHSSTQATVDTARVCAADLPPAPLGDDGWMKKAGTAAGTGTTHNRAETAIKVNKISIHGHAFDWPAQPRAGAATLPLLGERVTGHQRAFLKVQDGCDAHCTYCVIPHLRPVLWNKPIENAVEEAKRLVDAGHVELVLTGIFLGAYGQTTALRRRQPRGVPPLARLVEALCKNVPGLRRIRLSSLEPGDLNDELLAALASHEQVVPHFHLPLQSGSDVILRRMNRQYARDDFLRMIERVHAAFDRPALTTDIIVGFPGEGDEQFQHTLDVADRARFIHVHAFPFSARPGTAAARWTGQFVRGPIVRRRIEMMIRRAATYSFEFRSQFTGQTATVIAEAAKLLADAEPWRHGRCERYFPIHFEGPAVKAGDAVRLRIERVTPARTIGRLLDSNRE